MLKKRLCKRKGKEEIYNLGFFNKYYENSVDKMQMTFRLGFSLSNIFYSIPIPLKSHLSPKCILISFFF